ncbi:hypothetical protein [Arthrobacter sp. B1805]|nr:hypothetical protein [Arthrobacter sp. B1805]
MPPLFGLFREAPPPLDVSPVLDGSRSAIGPVGAGGSGAFPWS